MKKQKNQNNNKNIKKENEFINKLPQTDQLKNSLALAYGLRIFSNSALRNLLLELKTAKDLEKLLMLELITSLKTESEFGFLEAKDKVKFFFVADQNLISLLDSLSSQIKEHGLEGIKKELAYQALFKAIDELDREGVELALKLGADPNATKEGLSALDHVIYKQFEKKPSTELLLVRKRKETKALSDEFEEFNNKKLAILNLLKEYGAREPKKS
ncbi:MAG: hypothetical protein N3D10_03435 [Candidatus Micrarchaeota archaeon]|nr:hypothetical protein [Candidatus Micrarchaeota archaeon]